MLLYGEPIPTLEQALLTVVDNTSLAFVWLDTQFTGPMNRVQTLQQVFNERARQRGRRLQIVIGLPTTEAVQAQGRKVFVWTLNDLPFLEQFIDRVNLNGILSNYAPAVAYYHYTAQ